MAAHRAESRAAAFLTADHAACALPPAAFAAPPPAALTDRPVLRTLRGRALEWDGGLSMVQEWLDLLTS